MQPLLNTLLLSCKKATALIEKKSVLKLSTREKVMLHVHTSVCDACMYYEKQSKLIDDLLRTHLQDCKPEDVPQLSNEGLKERIITKIDNN